MTAIVLTVELNGLAGLLGKIVDNHGLNRHLDDVCGVRPIKFGTKKLRKIIINPHWIVTP